MASPASLLLTAVVSLAIGVCGTYATVHVTAQCAALPVVPSDPPPSHFFDAPAPKPDWSKRY